VTANLLQFERLSLCFCVLCAVLLHATVAQARRRLGTSDGVEQNYKAGTRVLSPGEG